MLRVVLLVVCACNVMGFAPIHVPLKASRSVAAAPALRMSTDGLISRRSFGSVAAAGLAALVVAKPSNAIEYSGTRNDGKWAVHEGAFKDEEFKGFITDPETGIKYKDLVVGKGKSPEDGDQMISDFKGYVLETGTKWGDSWEDGQPRASRAGAEPGQKFMKGLNNNQMTMKPGGKRIIVLPPAQAFSFMAIRSRTDPTEDSIPAYSTLVIYSELLDTKKVQ